MIDITRLSVKMSLSMNVDDQEVSPTKTANQIPTSALPQDFHVHVSEAIRFTDTRTRVPRAQLGEGY